MRTGKVDVTEYARRCEAAWPGRAGPLTCPVASLRASFETPGRIVALQTMTLSFGSEQPAGSQDFVVGGG